MIRYFAYGSNLLAARLQARTPSARLVTTARLPGHAPRFHKIGTDGSGKADAFRTESSYDVVYGAVYSISESDLAVLDQIEGVGSGYDRAEVTVEAGGDWLKAWVYLAESQHIDPAMRPFHWYKRFVLGGARHHGFAGAYIDQLAAVPSKPDPHWHRAEPNHRLLRQHAGHHFPDWPLRPDHSADH